MRPALATLILGLAAGLVSSLASAATLRPHAILRADKVHLSDIFQDLAPGQDTELGDAPALGKSYTLGGAQLTAIAAQFAVDWPDASPLATTTLERGAHIISEADILPLLRTALGLDPAATNIELTLTGFKSIAIPLESSARPTLKQISYHPPTNDHFTATLSIPSQPDTPLNGTVTITATALTVRHLVHNGDPLLPDNLQTITARATTLPEDALQTPENAIGLIARTTIQPGAFLAQSMLSHPNLIRRGDPVVISYITPGMHVTASGIALQDGGRSDVVRVLNPVTNMILVTHITERSQVELIPGFTPTPSGQHGAATSARNLPTL